MTTITPQDAQAIIARASNPGALNTTLAPVDLAQVRERIDPQGEARKAAEMIGRKFTIVEISPYASSFAGGRATVYWVKAVDENGVLFNMTLGGQVVCDALDALASLTAAWFEARQMGDDARVAELDALGAGRPVTVTLVEKHQGKYGRYYDFE